ncbi:MAG: biotin/lipoyl-binding protein, partial [Hyphomicrobiales bacterium]
MTVWKSLNQSLKKSDEHEFLPAALEVLEAPPSRSGRYMAFILGGFFVFAAVWAILGTIDIVVIAQGQTVPTGKVKTLQTLETGVVRAVHVKDGQFVEKGDLLVEMDPTETVANVDSLQAQWIQASVEAELGEALLKHRSAELSLPAKTPELIKANTEVLLVGKRAQHSAELTSIAADIERQESIIASAHIQRSMFGQKLPLLQERLAAQENLLEKGITQKPLVLELRESLIELLHQQQSVEESIHQAEAAIASLNARHVEAVSTYRSTAAQNRHEALNKLSSIEQELKKANQRQKYRELRAPVTGFVDKLAIYTIGAVVDSGTQVLTV